MIESLIFLFSVMMGLGPEIQRDLALGKAGLLPKMPGKVEIIKVLKYQECPEGKDNPCRWVEKEVG